MTHKAGFVNIIGNPNVGKSTLMNALVGEKLSIITPKAQTTRHRIMGIVNGPDYQIVYSDTPGIIRPHYLLQKNMMQFVDTALTDADIILYVTDVVEKMQKNPSFMEKLALLEIPVLVAINKIDISSEDEVRNLMSQWQTLLPQAGVYPVSALEGFNLDSLLQHILDHLPKAPPWFEKDRFTDKSLRFFASEILREKIFLNYAQEIPYCTEVEIAAFKETQDRYHIEAVIYVMRDSQKGILIGNQGKALKKTGTQARLDMEDFFQKKVYLELFVKVLPHWRDSRSRLRQFGY
ncbi:MAG: GTPase Era [Bacteroidales bacterium]|jgi:GTP-binding protein Era